MAMLTSGDENLHYCDGSHHWSSPSLDFPQKVWTEIVRTHLEAHRRNPDLGWMPVGPRPVA